MRKSVRLSERILNSISMLLEENKTYNNCNFEQPTDCSNTVLDLIYEKWGVISHEVQRSALICPFRLYKKPGGPDSQPFSEFDPYIQAHFTVYPSNSFEIPTAPLNFQAISHLSKPPTGFHFCQLFQRLADILVIWPFALITINQPANAYNLTGFHFALVVSLPGE